MHCGNPFDLRGDASRNLQEQAMLFEMSCKKLNPDIDRSITLEKYTEIWLQTIAPDKLAKSTLVREKQDIERFKPYLGSYKLVDLRPEHFRSLYTKLRKQKNKATGKPLSEATVEGVHSCLCGILSDAMEGGYLDHNPAWRTYKYAGQKKEKKIADDETVKKLIQALETVSILHEIYFKLIIATGMRRGECCALKWEDINYAERSIHVCRNAVKTTGDEIIVKAPKTKAGNRYVYFSAEMESLLREYEAFCAAETERYDKRKQTKDDYVFRRKGMKLPMTPSTFTWRFKKILKANDQPTDLNVHSLRHTAASLFIASGTDVGTVAGLLGHSQPSTTLDIYTHSTSEMQHAAARKIDCGIGKAELPDEPAPQANTPAIVDFQPYMGKVRKPGTGCISQINDHLFEGRYSPTWIDGKKHARNVYAHTREECEEKLKVLIAEMKAELAELKRQKADNH